jgi:hypothetical protein
MTMIPKPGSNNDSDLVEEVEEEMDYDWSMDAFNYCNVLVLFKDVAII